VKRSEGAVFSAAPVLRGFIMRSCIRALVPVLLGVALPAAAADLPGESSGDLPRWHEGIPRVAVYAMRIDPGAPLRQGAWNSGYGGGAEVSWPIPGTQGLFAAYGGAEVSSFYSGVRTVADSASGERAEHHMDQLYGRFFAGGELGAHSDGTLEPYANLALATIVYGYFDDVKLTAGDASQELLVSEHEVAMGWSAGAGVNLNFAHFGVTGGVRYLRQFGTPRQLGNGTVPIQPAYMQYRIGITAPFPVEP
jgi:hypothetical protein